MPDRCCKQCSEPIRKQKHHVFCSSVCHARWYSTHNRDGTERKIEKKNCRQCLVAISCGRSFCKKSCRTKWYKTHRRDGTEFSDIPCARCGKNISRKLRKNKKKFCSKKCFQVARKEWSKKGARAGHLKRLNFTIQQYDELALIQGDACAICRTTRKPGTKKFWFVDHCHQTLRVRGLLCSACNSGIGFLAESNLMLYRALNYLGNGGYDPNDKTMAVERKPSRTRSLRVKMFKQRKGERETCA